MGFKHGLERGGLRRPAGDVAVDERDVGVSVRVFGADGGDGAEAGGGVDVEEGDAVGGGGGEVVGEGEADVACAAGYDY